MSLSTNNSLIKELRKILLDNNIAVSEVQTTSGNYDDDGNLIDGVIPTITTSLCEIGIYSDTCYFTIIINSNLFTKRIFSELIKYSNVHIYGFKKFTEDYYPKEDFVYSEFEKQIQSEDFAQIQFDFDISINSPIDVFKGYLNIYHLFNEISTIAVDQLDSCF